MADELKPPGVGGGDDLGKNQEDLRRMMSLMFGAEAGGYTEVARKSTRAEVRHDTRMLMSQMEYFWWDNEQAPNTYLLDQGIIPNLHSRARQLEISIPLGFGSYSKRDQEAGIDQDPRARTELVHELDRSRLEITARRFLVGKMIEQDIFAGDVEEYLVNYFLRLGKARMDSKHYGVILNLPETYPGFEPYGEKVQKAIDLWRNVAQGKATIDVTTENRSDGTETTKTVKLPNLFAVPRNDGLLNITIDHYILANIGTNDPEVAGEAKNGANDALKALEAMDNHSAAITALLLIKHWDLDVEWSLSREGISQELTEDDISNLALELSTKDSEKAAFFELRRALEWAGNPNYEGRRDHPRVAGPPSTLGCYPRLTTDALSILSTQVIAVREVGDGAIEAPDVTVLKAFGKVAGVDLDDIELGTRLNLSAKQSEELIKALKSKGYLVAHINPENLDTVADLLLTARWKKINMSIKDQVWGGGEITRTESGKKVVWQYTPTTLGEIPWDNILIYDANGEVMDLTPSPEGAIENADEFLDYLLGVQTDGFEVPYKLQGFLAYKFLFTQLMRTDYTDQFNEIASGKLLLKINKGIDNALFIMMNAFNLDQELTIKLSNYIRTVYLGGLAASIIGTGVAGKGASHKLENQPQVPDTQLKSGQVRVAIENAARSARFLPFVEEPGKQNELVEPYKTLLTEIIENRKAPNPFELSSLNINIFTPEELEQLKPLYPLIAR